MPDYKMPSESLSLDNALHRLVCNASRLLATCRGLQKDAEFQSQLPFRRRNIVTGNEEEIDRTASEVLKDVYKHYARDSLCLARDNFSKDTEERLAKLIVEIGRLHTVLESFWKCWRQCNDQVDQLPALISEKMDEVSGRKAWRERLRSELNELATWHYWSGHDGLNSAVHVDILLSTLELSGIPDWRNTLDSLGAFQKNLRAFRVSVRTEEERQAKTTEMFRSLREYTKDCRLPNAEEIELFRRVVHSFDIENEEDWNRLYVALGLPADQSYRRPHELADLARRILWNEDARRQEERRLNGDIAPIAVPFADSAPIATTNESPGSKDETGADNPPDKYQHLRKWVSNDLKGKQRRVMELVIEGDGSVPIADVAIDRAIEWGATGYDDSARSICRVLRTKLMNQGWRMHRHDKQFVLTSNGQK